MAFFTTGHAFVGGEQVTHTKLNQLINDATPINFDRTAFGTGSRIISVQDGKPSSPATGEMAWDSSEAALFVYDGTSWVGVSPRQEQLLTAAVNLSAGDVVIQDTTTANQVTTTTTAGHHRAVGVAPVAVTGTPATARLVVAGIVSVNCDATAVTIGDLIGTSTTAGQGTPVTDGTAFGVALTSKGAGAGPVTVLLRMPQPVTARVVTTTYATYAASASLTSGTWYDVPNANVGAGITVNGSSAMKVAFTTTHANQLVRFRVKDMAFVNSATAGAIFTGIRFALDSTSTIIAGATKPSSITSTTVPAASTFMPFAGIGATWQSTAGTLHGLTIPEYQGVFQISSAGSHSIFIQFLAGSTATYTFTQSTTATLQAILEYA